MTYFIEVYRNTVTNSIVTHLPMHIVALGAQKAIMRQPQNLKPICIFKIKVHETSTN